MADLLAVDIPSAPGICAPIHFIGVKKDADLRRSDSVMQAAMCSCELQIQWKGGTWV